MKTEARPYFELVLSKLQHFGLLLESDPKLPSVCALITGTPVRGSWWSHPLSHEIFAVNGKLEDHQDVLITKLLSGKVTFVHRKLWPEIFAIGSAREPWQMKNLSPSARAILRRVDEQGPQRTDKLSPASSTKLNVGTAARELEKKLLIHAGEFHTETGAHAKLLESWEGWARRVGFNPVPIPADEARKLIEERLRELNEQYRATATLPWK